MFPIFATLSNVWRSIFRPSACSVLTHTVCVHENVVPSTVVPLNDSWVQLGDGVVQVFCILTDFLRVMCGNLTL